jgi:hypothetical protein
MLQNRRRMINTNKLEYMNLIIINVMKCMWNKLKQISKQGMMKKLTSYTRRKAPNMQNTFWRRTKNRHEYRRTEDTSDLLKITPKEMGIPGNNFIYTGCGKLTSFFEYEMPYEKGS